MDRLQHLHKVLLIIMDEFDRVCKKNRINYTLAGGSMLGAVRHRGFIPWDDDIDVALTRTNYEKLIERKDDFKPEFFLQTNHTDEKFCYGYAKLLLSGTVAVESGHENTEYRKGIYIDIFPLDNVPDIQSLKKRHKKRNYFIHKMLRQKSNIKDDPSWTLKTKIIFRMLDIFCLFFSRKKLIEQMNKNMTEFNDRNTKQIANLCGMYGYEKECVPADWFDSYKTVQFEDRYYDVIKECNVYLKCIYGNYMEIPSVEQQHTHNFMKLDFGNY